MAGGHLPSTRRRPAAPRGIAAQPLSDRELDELQSWLDRVPAPLEPLDVSMLDGFLCGVLVQPQPLPASRWLPHVTDVEGRALPRRFDAARLHALVARRHAELDAAIGHRRWFDPWVFEIDGDHEATRTQRRDPRDAPGSAAPESNRGGAVGVDATEQDDAMLSENEAMPPDADAVYPWVAGFATALELFPALLEAHQEGLTEALALLYRHLAPEDLEDADDLLVEIETLEPPADLAEAVEGLVRATLLLADVGRPLTPRRPHRSS